MNPRIPWTSLDHLHPTGSFQDISRPTELSGSTPSPLWGIPRSFWMIQDHSDPHEDSLNHTGLYWDISRSCQCLLRAPGPILGASRFFQGPPQDTPRHLGHLQTLLAESKDFLDSPGDTLAAPRPFWDITGSFWMTPVLEGGGRGGKKRVSGASMGWSGPSGGGEGGCGESRGEGVNGASVRWKGGSENGGRGGREKRRGSGGLLWVERSGGGAGHCGGELRELRGRRGENGASVGQKGGAGEDVGF